MIKLIPHVTHRRVNVGKVPSALRHMYPLRRAVTRRKNEIKSTKIQRLRRPWIKRQQVAMKAGGPRNFLQKRRARIAVGKNRIAMQKRKQFSIGKHLQKRLEYPFPPTVGNKPIVHQRN